jgi:DNA/RNA endonuclease YhcR with UshA esterase domain
VAPLALVVFLALGQVFADGRFHVDGYGQNEMSGSRFRRMLMFVRCLFLAGMLATPALAADDKDKPLTPVEARKQIGKEITVELEVKSAKNALAQRGEIYLDSEENFRDEKNFAVVITKKGAESLKAAGIDDPADHFRGKTIQAKGKVTEVDGVPRIEIDEAKQISIPEKK